MVYYVLMGLFDRFLTSQTPTIQTDVAAANTPYNLQSAVGGLFYGAQTATREQAMSVPSVARARNIICATIASLPLETYNHFTKEHLDPNRVIMQPDPRIAGSAIYAWVAEDLLFHGIAYGIVLDSYAASDNSRVRAWTRVAPDRVTYNLNANQTEITSYMVDGLHVPATGIGSLIVFSGLDRNYAMQVPAVSRCRNLIAGVVSYLPLKLYKKSNGEALGNPLWIDQPDYRQPRSVTISWTVDSLLFYGVAYGMVMDAYAATDASRIRAWTRIAPGRVSKRHCVQGRQGWPMGMDHDPTR